jgi:hypothetical protein
MPGEVVVMRVVGRKRKVVHRMLVGGVEELHFRFRHPERRRATDLFCFVEVFEPQLKDLACLKAKWRRRKMLLFS